MIALRAWLLNLRAFFSGGVITEHRAPPGDLAGGDAARDGCGGASKGAWTTIAVSELAGAFSYTGGSNDNDAPSKHWMSFPTPPSCFFKPGADKCAWWRGQFPSMDQGPETTNHSGKFAWESAQRQARPRHNREEHKDANRTPKIKHLRRYAWQGVCKS